MTTNRPTPEPENLDPHMSIVDVPRNDVAAARRYYEAHGKRIDPDGMHMLLMLQDDPTELERVSKRWNVVKKAAPTP